VEGVARFYGHHGGRQYGYQDSERPKPGDTTYDVGKVKTREGLIGQDIYDAKHPARAPQAREDRHAPNYNNDAKGWVRAASGEPNCYGEDATLKPNFDHSPPRNKMRR
jgi:hypothetical protein